MKGAVMEIRMKNNHDATETLHSPDFQWTVTYGFVWIVRADRDGKYTIYTEKEWEIQP